MPIDDTTAKQLQAVSAYAQAALEDVFTGNPSYVKYLEAFVRLFSAHVSMNKGLAQELRDIAARLFTNYEENSEENPDALTELQGSIKMLLQEVINDPDFPISKWQIASPGTPEIATDNDSDSSIDSASIKGAIQEATTEDSDEFSEYSEIDFDDMEDNEDDGLDFETMLARADAELQSAADKYKNSLHNLEAKLDDLQAKIDLDDRDVDESSTFMAKEPSSPAFDDTEGKKDDGLGLEKMIAETDAELQSAVAAYQDSLPNLKARLHNLEAKIDLDDTDTDEVPAESPQAFMAKELFSPAFEQCLKTFRKESLKNNQSNFVGNTVDKLIKDIKSLHHASIGKELTAEALTELADSCQGLIVSWGRLANMKIKSNDHHSASIKTMITALGKLSESLSTLVADTKEQLNNDRPSL